MNPEKRSEESGPHFESAIYPTEIEYWAFCGRVEKIEELIRDGADVNAAREDGSTALHAAALNNHSKVVLLLLKHGANINAKLKSGDTPLDFVIDVGLKEMEELLRRHGAMANLHEKRAHNCK